jgi:hypothetical protein
MGNMFDCGGNCGGCTACDMFDCDGNYEGSHDKCYECLRVELVKAYYQMCDYAGCDFDDIFERIKQLDPNFSIPRPEHPNPGTHQLRKCSQEACPYRRPCPYHDFKVSLQGWESSGHE